MTEGSHVESFRGGYEELAAVIKEAWGQSKDQSLIFDEAFLRSAMEYPGCSLDLTAAIYVNGELAAFEAGFPRRVVLNGREQSFLCLTFWTTSAKFQGKGYGSQVKTELLRRAREHGFDGAVVFCADGAASNCILNVCTQRSGAYLSQVLTVKYLAKLLRPAPVGGETVGDDFVGLFLRAANCVNRTVPLVRRWSRQEAEWQSRLRSGALCSSLEKEARYGVCTGYVVSTQDSKVLLLDDFLWEPLQSDERLNLLQELLSRAEFSGARMAIAPLMGYTEVDTLRRAGFRQTRRVMNMYVVTWKETLIPPLSAAYLDVY